MHHAYTGFRAHRETVRCFVLCKIYRLYVTITVASSTSMQMELLFPFLSSCSELKKRQSIIKSTFCWKSEWFVCLEWGPACTLVLSCLILWVSMLNMLLRAGSYYLWHQSWQKKIAAVPCEIYARGYFLAAGTQGMWKEKKYSVLCRLWEELDLKEPTPCTFCKQGKQTYRKTWWHTQCTFVRNCWVIDYSPFWQWSRCHQTMIKTTTPECDTTSCHVLWHQFQLLSNQQWLNPFPWSSELLMYFTEQTCVWSLRQ